MIHHYALALDKFWGYKMIKSAYIGSIGNGKWRVYSKKGKNLGTFDSYAAAKKHLAEVEMFKSMRRQKKKNASANEILRSIELFVRLVTS